MMRTSRKKLLRLDEKTCYCDDLDFPEEVGEYRSDSRRKPRYKPSSEEVFKCKHCRRFVGPLHSGGRQRIHCPCCLYSLHVDHWNLGDRMSDCACTIDGIGCFQRANEEYVIV